MCDYFQRLVILISGFFIWIISFGQSLILKDASAIYYGDRNQQNNLNRVFTSISEIDNTVRDLEFRSRSTTDHAEAREIRFLITQLIEMRNQIQRTRNTLLQMRNLSPRYRRQFNQDRYSNLNNRQNIVNNQDRYRHGYGSQNYNNQDRYRHGYGSQNYNNQNRHRQYYNNQNYNNRDNPRYSSVNDFYGNSRADTNRRFPQMIQDRDPYLLHSAYFVKDDPVKGATDMQLDFVDSGIYDTTLEDFVDARLPISRINPYSNNLQLSEAGKQIIKARFELAEYLFFNGLKARGLFVVRDLLHSISVDDTWSMNQIIQLGDKLKDSTKYRDVAVHIFKLGFKKYRGLPVAANFLIRAGIISYHMKDNKDACLCFMTIRDGYPYEKKIFIQADIMAKKLRCPPNKVNGDIIW